MRLRAMRRCNRVSRERTLLGRVLIMAALLTGPVAQAMDKPSDLRDLLTAYRCPLVDRLQRVHDFGDPAEDRDRFLIVALPAPSWAYVQCIFHDTNTWLLCEAASGVYFDKPGAPRTARLSAKAIAALGRLGFSTDDSKENFKFDFAIPKTPDYPAIADLLLTALHDGYGGRGDMALEFTAPFAEKATTSCDPVS